MNSIPRIGIGVLIFNSRNEILLGKRMNSHGAQTWAPPGGHLEFGESFEDCAIREVREETGMVIENPVPYTVSNDFFEQEGKHYVSILMKARLPTQATEMNLEPHKTHEWQWFDFHCLPDNLFSSLKSIKESKCYRITP